MQFYSEPTLFTEADVSTVSENFLKIFPKQELQDAYANFSWGAAKTSAEAIDVRNAIFSEFSDWANSGNLLPNASEQIQKVHKWGFGRYLNKRESILLAEPHFSYFLDMIHAWQNCQEPLRMLETLERCLLTPYVKIARLSKWICFIDQSKYAIYDSRVSLALRNILMNEKRVFPTLGAKSKGRPKGDFVSANPVIAAKKIAAIYMLYLDVLHTTIDEYELPTVAHMEMALFMLGVKKEYW